MAEPVSELDVVDESRADMKRPAGSRAQRRVADRAPAGSPGRKRPCADWRPLRRRLAGVCGKWVLAILVNLQRGAERPGDLIEEINAQGREKISWKVLIQTLRRLEEEGYVDHRQVSKLPRVTRYWLRPAGRRLIGALERLDTWCQDGDTADSQAADGISVIDPQTRTPPVTDKQE